MINARPAHRERCEDFPFFRPTDKEAVGFGWFEGNTMAADAPECMQGNSLPVSRKRC